MQAGFENRPESSSPPPVQVSVPVESGYVGVLESSEDLQVKHFRTDHLLANIGHRAVSGGFVTITAQAGKFILNFAAAAVLARLLNPRDFGLVGMVLGVTGVVSVFKELGLSTATVQRETITQEQVSNLFWINVGFSGILSAFCAALAPLVSWFYRDPRILGIMLALSLTFVITGSTVQHQALLTRQMRFQALAIIDLSSLAIGFFTACILAWIGFGYWALVAQQLATAAGALGMTWVVSGWRPKLPTRNSGVMPMVKFGAHLGLADFVAQFSANSDSILLGRFYGAAPLGLYTRAQVLLARPIQQIVAPINAVLIPVLSRLQLDPERYRRSYMRAYGGLAVFIFSFSAMCLALARPLVLVILGPKWTGVIPLFAAFSVVAISTPLAAICSWIYESQGRGPDQLQNHTIAGMVTIVAFLLGLRWGPMGVVTSLAIISLVVRLPIVYYIAGKRGPVRTRDLWMGFLTHLPCWIAIFGATALTYKVVVNAHPIVQLLVCCPIGIVVGAALMLLFPHPRQSAFFVAGKVTTALKARFAKS
jgi:O-antigen/teichoic acid export membrane protein